MPIPGLGVNAATPGQCRATDSRIPDAGRSREKVPKPPRMGGGSNRDFTLILVAYRHSLRARGICELEWSHVEFGRSAALHVRRGKNGKPTGHPIRGDELRRLTALRREFPNNGYGFSSGRGTAFSTDAVNRLLK